uniref:Uncharacterized protein n=1 Tax=Arundo donax TaxID=35708 RepID=A0A0A9FH25_ARUDO
MLNQRLPIYCHSSHSFLRWQALYRGLLDSNRQRMFAHG